MHKLNRLLTNICSQDLHKSKAFYTQLFDFKVTFDSEWFILLQSDQSGRELGIIDKNNILVPTEFRGKADGLYLTFVIDNVDELYIELKEKQLQILQAPKDTFYGQRRMLLTDPDGTLIDVSSLVGS